MSQLLFPNMIGQASPRRAGARAVDHGRECRREAYQASQPRHSGDRLRVVELLRSQPAGLTRHEIAAQLQLPLTTVCGRVNELAKMGEVHTTGARRPIPNGGTASVVTYRPEE